MSPLRDSFAERTLECWQLRPIFAQGHLESLEERVEALESQLQESRKLQLRRLVILEEHFGRDRDGDGKVG